MKILELINKTTDFFSQKGVESPRLQIELILSHVLKLNRMALYLQFDRELTASELDQLRPLVKRRADREPLQHITGETGFYGLTLECNPAALIPRPETEVLVEWVVESLKGEGTGLIYDVGTGTGAIALALAKHLPSWRVVGTDISSPALEVAARNRARMEGVQVQWLECDLLPGIKEQHVIVANLPYLTTAEMTGLPPEVRFDPVGALDGGADGLDLIRRLLGLVNEHTAMIFLEAGAGHAEALSGMLSRSGFEKIEVRPDLNGVRRFVQGKRI